jgi:ceramide glucosyltransferase
MDSVLMALGLVLSIIGLVSAAYQVAVLIACIRQLVMGGTPVRNSQPVSILKPVRGLDPDFLEAIRSHARQEYDAPFELLFGAADKNDPCLPVIEQLRREFPDLPIKIIHSTTKAPNAKVGVLMDLLPYAEHPLLLVNDSDILVPPGYLRKVTAPLDHAHVGLCTCLYRATSRSVSGRWEALGIAVDFAPSVLVATLVGVREFGLGATLVFRKTDLARIGGFEAIREFLADDYQLAKRITGLGLKAQMSEVVVETSLGDDTWAGVWRHQVRWARTIRVSRGDGFLGLPVTHTGLWILAVLLAGMPMLALSLLLLRWSAAFLAGAVLLKSRIARNSFWLAPIWDLWAFFVWTAGLGGNTVVWRDGVLKLSKDGRLLPEV